MCKADKIPAGLPEINHACREMAVIVFGAVYFLSCTFFILSQINSVFPAIRPQKSKSMLCFG